MSILLLAKTFLEEHSNTDRTPYLFNGKELDEETGLYYYGARYYDAKTSVWQSVDPLVLYDPVMETEAYLDGQHNGGVINSGNLASYSYTYGNPIKYIDPNGKQSVSEFIEGAGEGLHDLGEALAPVRPAPESDPKTFSEWWNNLKSAPSNIKKTYREGTFKDKVRLTVGLLAIIKGKSKTPKVSNIAKAGLSGQGVFGKCIAFANAFVKKKGGVVKTIDLRDTGFMNIGTAKTGLSLNGFHKFVEKVVDGKKYIYDNMNPNGVLKADYIKSLEAVNTSKGLLMKGEHIFKNHVK